MSHSTTGFYHLGIAPDVLKVLDRMKFKTPTPIQEKAIPIALEGKDVMGVAQTGTGKTMAFGIPTIQRLAADGGQALILVPTRELAVQVDQALWPLLKPFQMKSVVLIGGVKIGGQISDIKRHPDIIVATPGRLNDHIYQGTIDLGGVKIVILDEADRMFDMGFEPQVKSILRCVTNKEQTMLFSATMPPSILKLAMKNMKLPITIEVAPSGTKAEDVSQELFIVKEAVKNEVLQMLLQQYRGTVLVFIRTRLKATRICRNIRDMGAKVAEIHSNRSMGQRNQAIEGFKRGRYRVLVATDIAARGIDVSMIELVVNYDLPDEAENYVHRIGRTGRAGETGHAVSFATPAQSRDVQKIEALMKMALPRSEHPDFAQAQFSKGGDTSRGRSSGGRSRGSSQGRPRSDSRKSSSSSGERSKSKDGYPRTRNAKNPSRRTKKDESPSESRSGSRPPRKEGGFAKKRSAESFGSRSESEGSSRESRFGSKSKRSGGGFASKRTGTVGRRSERTGESSESKFGSKPKRGGAKKSSFGSDSKKSSSSGFAKKGSMSSFGSKVKRAGASKKRR